MQKKNNNKGFSLVELIVVVLIMAIIAVALAPQVMKWVNNSRITSDQNTAGVIKSAAQAAFADMQAHGVNMVASAEEYTIVGNDYTDPANAKLAPYFTGANGSLGSDNYASKYDDAGFTVNITDKGVVTVTYTAANKSLE